MAMLRVMEPGDVPVVASLHRRYLRRGFLGDLDGRRLERHYQTFVGSPAAVALVGECRGALVGYLVGTVDEFTHCRVASLRTRSRLTAGFERARASRQTTGPAERVGVLHHLVVAQGAQRRGLGRTLAYAFADIARTEGTHRLTLEVRQDNQAAQDFYRDIGWTPCGDDRSRRWLAYGLQL
ncbi:GNAT family N-acetyltransferase [Actinomadura sp. SCN-SB]|uniref:GNAT family N-acetyltransferase n=1 Tax=Actinomadura sp. SCN-SB TaxID=3373092 RepID=UPI003753E6E7